MNGDFGKKTFKTYYLDDEHNIVDREHATKTVVTVYDENGNLIEEKWGLLRKPGKRRKYNESEIELTPEMVEILRNVKDMNGNYLFRESVDKELVAANSPGKKKTKIIKKLFGRKRDNHS